MLAFVRYGIKTSLIGADEYLVRCPSCESDNWADVGIISNYYHFYYVPIFPFEKDAYVACKKCGLKRTVPFDEKLVKNFSEIKGQYHHPWYTYIGIAIMVVFILLGILSSA